MTDKRKKQIILLILTWFKSKENKIIFTNTIKWHYGICGVVEELLDTEQLTDDEEEFFKKFIMDNNKTRWEKDDNFIYAPGRIKPRVNYLNRLLIELKK